MNIYRQKGKYAKAACSRKKQYKSAAEAKKVAHTVATIHSSQKMQREYFCSVCSKFHLTSS